MRRGTLVHDEYFILNPASAVAAVSLSDNPGSVIRAQDWRPMCPGGDVSELRQFCLPTLPLFSG